MASFERDNSVEFYYLISMHMKSGLIRGVSFGGNGLIRGVSFGGSGLIRGVSFGGNGLIRGVSFGGSGLIRGGLLYTHTCPIYPSLQNGLYLNVHLQHKVWILNPWRHGQIDMSDRYEFSIFEGMGWEVWILNLWRYRLTGINAQSLKVWANMYESSIFEGMAWQVWILNIWRYGLTGMNSQSLKVWANRYAF